MAGLALALVAFVAFTAVSADSGCGHSRWGGAGRAAANNLRIHDLEEQLTALQERVEARKKLGTEKMAELNHLRDRVDDFRGTGCPGKYDFSCGGYSSQCVSGLLVCDRAADCANGADETEENCFDIAHAGQVLEGSISGEHCSPHQNPTHISVSITGETRHHWFPSVEDITAHVTIDYADGSSLSKDLEGKYYFGTHTLVIYHGEGHTAVDLECHFTHGKDDHCYAKFVREDDGSVCGHATLHALY